MNQPSETARPAAAHFGSTNGPHHGKAPSILENARKMGEQALVFSEAQLTIWKLKALRIFALAMLGIPAAVAFLALAIYGFALLDKAAAIALDTAPYPHWFSPLVRGGCYMVFTLVIIGTFWRACIGSMSSKK